jgi:hypothetical protein
MASRWIIEDPGRGRARVGKPFAERAIAAGLDRRVEPDLRRDRQPPLALVARHAHHPRLVGERVQNRLTDPERRVGHEPCAVSRIEAADRPEQSEAPFVDQVLERHATVPKLHRDPDDERDVLPQQLVDGARLSLPGARD